MSDSTNRAGYGKATIKGTMWQYLTFFSGKLMVLVSTAVLARLLSQEDFGVVGYALATISFVDVISDLGVGPALIYFPEDRRTASTGFWLNLLIGGIVFGITWLIAPLAGIYFRDPRATTVLQVMGLVYPFRAIGGTHDAILNKRLEFNRMFVPELLRSLVKGLASMLFAWLGFGHWSLIWGYLSGTLISSVAYWFITPWHPSFIFDWQVVRSLFKYGLSIVGVDIVAILLVNLDYLLVGRYLGAAALGTYTIAFRLPDLIILQFARILSYVIFPIYTKMRSTAGSLKRGFLKTTRYLALVTIPLGLGLALVAHPLTILIFSEKWEASAPVIQYLALYSLFLSLAYTAGSVYKAEGRPQILTWLGLARLVMLAPALWWAVTVARSITTVGLMQAVVALLGTILSLYVATRLIDLTILELLEALRPSLIAGLIMAVGVQTLLNASPSLDPLWRLALGITAGGTIYLIVLFLIQRDVLITGWNQLQSVLQRN